MGSHQEQDHPHRHGHPGGPGHPAHHREDAHAGSDLNQDVSGCNQMPSAVLAPVEKLIKMLQHWLHHNEEHARSFSDWAERARGMDRTDVATLIEDAARQSLAQNERFQKALDLLKSAPRKPA